MAPVKLRRRWVTQLVSEGDVCVGTMHLSLCVCLSVRVEKCLYSVSIQGMYTLHPTDSTTQYTHL